MDVEENRILAAVFRIGLMIHKKLGPGLFESVYEAILAHELAREGFAVKCQCAVPLQWDGLAFDKAFRADLVVNDLVVVEVKATEVKHPVHSRQLRTYLQLMQLRLGAVVNFGMVTFKEGFERVANGMPD